MIIAPTVTLVASTMVLPEAKELMAQQEDTTAVDHTAVLAGRTCYQSYGRAYAPTAADEDYLRSTVLQQAHYSVAEHAILAFHIAGVSRSLTHELVRHRHFGYSQLSQRYVDSAEMDWVCPIEFLDDEAMRWDVQEVWDRALVTYGVLVRRKMEQLAAEGVTGTEARKRARQAARAVLPNCAETRLVVSGNPRAWREAMEKRSSPGAEPEIRRLFAEHLLPILKTEAPFLFADYGSWTDS